MTGYVLAHPPYTCIPAQLVDVSASQTAFFAFQDTVSVHRPSFYANRFLKFMGSTVFKKINRKLNTISTYYNWNSIFKILSQCVLALRGASSRRKRSSLNAAKSASQEILSTQRDERKDEKRAQSMDNLDGNGKLWLKHFRSRGSQHLWQFRISFHSCIWFSICFLQSCTVPPSNRICCQELLCRLSPAEMMKRTSTTGTLSVQHSDL